MKKTALAVCTLLLLLASTFQLSSLAKANPVIYYSNGGSVHPSIPGATQPIIEIPSPQNNSVSNQDNVTLALNVTVGDSTTPSSRWIQLVYYKADWQQSNIYVYRYMNDEQNPPAYSTTLNLTGINNTSIPEGKHTLTVYVNEEGQYYDPPRPDGSLCKIVYYSFGITGSSTVTFTVDRTSPSIIFLSVENKTYTEPDIPLNFAVNEPVSKVTYSLDGYDNVSVAENTTLTNLSSGIHNITIHAWDEAGNIGSSQTISFTVAEPFPTTLLIGSVVAVVAVVGLGLMIYLKKRHR
jgi:hypothetical protein